VPVRHRPRGPVGSVAPAATGLAAILIALAAIVLIFWSGNDLEEWKEWCHYQGGHVKHTSELAGGGRNTWVNYTNYCLTSDGRIIDIRE
jgi:hypothetical protein